MERTLKIGLISDTHIPTRARELPDKIFEIFKDIDYIIHAGDYVNFSVIEKLQKIAPIIGCYGNMDPYSLKKRLPKIGSLEIKGKVIKLIHDLGRGSQIKNLQKSGVDVIVHGHTHKVSVKKIGNLLIINPGSATNSFYNPNSIGILYLAPDHIDYEIIELI